MIAYAPAWAVWLVLGLWGAALVALAVAVVMGRRWWAQVRPLVAPYISMFVEKPKPDDPLDVQRAPHRQ